MLFLFKSSRSQGVYVLFDMGRSNSILCRANIRKGGWNGKRLLFFRKNKKVMSVGSDKPA